MPVNLCLCQLVARFSCTKKISKNHIRGNDLSKKKQVCIVLKPKAHIQNVFCILLKDQIPKTPARFLTYNLYFHDLHVCNINKLLRVQFNMAFTITLVNV